MSYKKRENKRSHPVRNFIFTLLIVLIAGTAFLWFAGPLKHQVAKRIGTQIMESAADSAARQIAESSGGLISEESAKQQIRQGMESMSEEDRETLTGIVENHLDGSEVADITGKVISGDVEGAVKLAEQELTEEEYQALQKMAEKYLGEDF
ncbi:hypothetical protein [Lachnoclostridium sp. Marseille-P6806]|uniref:hypothetical protein n=1 Tax=Lachnoclostridium sp. Marseille-P6806 TaxID=2364793 RepID=UPI001031AF33|nr:hypothetical protein [Lachnoclostridium sp. Marseille-P6806]